MQVLKYMTQTQHLVKRNDIRNVAIIAHVDHGKTTLVDGLLKQSHIFRENQHVGELIMDTNDQERERGITILAKNTAIIYRGIKINIIDTPGHADFGGEVERVLNMADGCILLIDAVEGPMPQTRFVLQKALELNLQPIVVINKIDRRDARIDQVLEWTQDLFLELATTDAHLNFPVLYAIGRDGVAMYHSNDERRDLEPLFETIINTVPAAVVDTEAPLQMLVAALDYDDYKGKYAIGRIVRGRVTPNTFVAHINRDGVASRQKINLVMTYNGLQRIEVPEALAGDIVALTGIANANIGETIADVDYPEALPTIAITKPTLKMTFSVNTSPFAGHEGKSSTSRQLRARLYRELETNVSLRVEDGSTPDEFIVSGRGELHLSVLIETMRREGYEFQVSRPRIIPREGPNGERLEPYEELMIDCPEGYLGVVMEKLGPRRAELLDMKNPGVGMVRMRFKIPARGLLGYRSEFLTDTRGTGVMHHRFFEYGRWAGPLSGRSRGVMVADREGVAVAFALFNLQERGTMFVKPGDAVYEGMVVGENARTGDMDVNPSKEKKLTNMRTTASDEMIMLEPPRLVTLELALEYIEDDELIEVTPSSIRLRKRALGATERRKLARNARAAEES